MRMCKLSVFFLLLVVLSSQANQKIRILKSPWCPYVCNENNKNRPGYIAEVVHHILTTENYDIEYFELNFARGLQLVERGELDLILNVFECEGNNLTLNKIPVTYSENYFYTLANSSWQYKDAYSLQGMMVGAIQGYDYIDEALNLHINTQRENSVTMVSGEQAQVRLLQLLNLRRIDTFLDDLLVVSYEQRNSPSETPLRIAGQTQGPEPVFIGISPYYASASQLAEVIDKGLQTRSTGKWHQQIKNKYESLLMTRGMTLNDDLISPKIQIALAASSLNSIPTANEE